MPLRIRTRSATANECSQPEDYDLNQLPDHDSAAAPPAASAGLGSRALRNTVTVLGAKVVARLIALVTVIYIINSLEPRRYGAFTVLVNCTAIVSVVLDLGFNVLFVREGARHRDDIERYLRNVMSVRLVMSVLSLVLLVGVLMVVGLSDLIVPGFFLMVLTSYSTLLRNGLYAVQQLGYEAIAVILESVVLLALVLYGRQTHQGVTYFVWAYAAQYAFSCVYFSVVLAVKRIAVIGWRFEPDLVREWFWKGLPFALTFVLTILYFRIDQPLVFALKSQTEAGWYGAAYKPIEALLFIPMTFLSVVFPVLSVYHRERQTEVLDALNRFYKALLLMGWPMSVGIFVLAYPLNAVMRLYAPSAPALQILALALGFAFVNNAFIGALNASDRQLSFTWAAGWSLAANVVLNLALIPTFGYLGASWATVLTEIALGIAGWVLTARHVGRVPILALSWRIVLAGLVMGVAIFPLRELGGVKVAIPIAAGVLVYTAAVLLLRALSGEEIAWARRALALAR
ncbi:MAG: flippase [Chloroflexi bacterium]|nr:MAG: flippase [Chloroflexota bacterium]TMF80099.1 MAG: flippase [Chloroflexota bacterium]